MPFFYFNKYNVFLYIYFYFFCIFNVRNKDVVVVVSFSNAPINV